MVITVLFCIGDIDAALSTNTGYPFMEIFLQATNSVVGSAVMAALVTVLALCSTVGLLASTSRMFWSFARDRGLPGWKTLHTVLAILYRYSNSPTKYPLGQPPDIRTHLVCRHNYSDIVSSCPHQYRLRHRLQRHSLTLRRRAFHLLPIRSRIPALPTLHKHHQYFR